MFTVKDPERLVLDLETDELSPALAELQRQGRGRGSVHQGLRVARNRPGVVRLVLDLKAEVKPQIFTPAAGRRVRPSPGARHLSRGRRSIRSPR